MNNVSLQFVERRLFVLRTACIHIQSKKQKKIVHQKPLSYTTHICASLFTLIGVSRAQLLFLLKFNFTPKIKLFFFENKKMDFNRQDSKTKLKPIDDQTIFEVIRRSSLALEVSPIALNVEIDRRSKT